MKGLKTGGRKPGTPDRAPRFKPVRTPAVTGKTVKFLAQGKSVRAVAAATGQSVGAVHKTRQENLEQIANLAAEIFNDSLAQMQPVLPKVIERLNQATETGDSRDLDATSRAALNVGKLVATATGADESGHRDNKLMVEIVLPDWSKPRLRQVDGRVIDVSPTRFLRPGVSEVSWPPRDHPQPAIEASLGDPEDPNAEEKARRSR